jgi:DNA-directed RNA polymerase delta subunit
MVMEKLNQQMKSDLDMNHVKESMNNMFNAIHHERIINQFAKAKYLERFPSDPKIVRYNGDFHIYDGFEVVSPTRLIVKYKYGVGEMEYEKQFIVDIE